MDVLTILGLVAAVSVIVLLVVLEAKAKEKKRSRGVASTLDAEGASPKTDGSEAPADYRRVWLLSKAERSFYGVLVEAVGQKGLVFAKVRVADVLAPRGLRGGPWQRAFNAISAKHFDFVICDPGNCFVKLAIELDDASHDNPKRQQRDAFLDHATASAGLPLVRLKAARGYQLLELRERLEGYLVPSREESVVADVS